MVQEPILNVHDTCLLLSTHSEDFQRACANVVANKVVEAVAMENGMAKQGGMAKKKEPFLPGFNTIKPQEVDGPYTWYRAADCWTVLVRHRCNDERNVKAMEALGDSRILVIDNTFFSARDLALMSGKDPNHMAQWLQRNVIKPGRGKYPSLETFDIYNVSLCMHVYTVVRVAMSCHELP